MKITGTRSYILVEIENKVLKIQGELTTSPAFYADTNSIICWESPFESERIDELERSKIIEQIIQYSKDKELKIYFE